MPVAAVFMSVLAVLLRICKLDLNSVTAAWLALGLTTMLEFSQLLHSPALVAARLTLPGRLALGSTFSWWDFPPYLLGAVLAAKCKRPSNDRI